MSKAKKKDEGEELTVTHDGEVVEGKTLKSLVVAANFVTVLNCDIESYTLLGQSTKFINCTLGKRE